MTSTFPSPTYDSRTAYLPSDSQETFVDLERDNANFLDFNLNYKLPPLIKAFQQSWQTSFQNSAVVTSMLTAAAAQILAMIKSDNDIQSQRNGVYAFLNSTSYCAILFNASSTITALLLIDRLAEIDRDSSRKRNEKKLEKRYMPERPVSQILSDYGAGAVSLQSWNLMVYHWFTGLICGILCIFLQLVTYVALREDVATIATVGAVVLFACMPFIEPILRSVFGSVLVCRRVAQSEKHDSNV